MTAPLLTTLRRFRQAGLPAPKMLDTLLRWRRTMLIAGIALAATTAALVVTMVVLVAVTAPVAVPAAIAGKVLSGITDLFGGARDGGVSAEELAEAGRDNDLGCRPVTGTAVTSTTPAPAAPADTETAPAHDGPQAAEPTTAAAPMMIRDDGTLSRHDAETLVEAVPPYTSALTAHVWFLYRMAGLGDWNQFTEAYTGAGLDDRDSATDAPLAQVQKLNTVGADIEPYRLTAAALTLTGMETGRYRSPGDDYRELLATELMTSCLAEASGMLDQRMQLPPPAPAEPPAPDSHTAPDTGPESGDEPAEQAPSA